MANSSFAIYFSKWMLLMAVLTWVGVAEARQLMIGMMVKMAIKCNVLRLEVSCPHLRHAGECCGKLKQSPYLQNVLPALKLKYSSFAL